MLYPARGEVDAFGADRGVHAVRERVDPDRGAHGGERGVDVRRRGVAARETEVVRDGPGKQVVFLGHQHDPAPSVRRARGQVDGGDAAQRDPPRGREAQAGDEACRSAYPDATDEFVNRTAQLATLKQKYEDRIAAVRKTYTVPNWPTPAGTAPRAASTTATTGSTAPIHRSERS